MKIFKLLVLGLMFTTAATAQEKNLSERIAEDRFGAASLRNHILDDSDKIQKLRSLQSKEICVLLGRVHAYEDQYRSIAYGRFYSWATWEQRNRLIALNTHIEFRVKAMLGFCDATYDLSNIEDFAKYTLKPQDMKSFLILVDDRESLNKSQKILQELVREMDGIIQEIYERSDKISQAPSLPRKTGPVTRVEAK
jgi:hypothetical protein